ncbi:MAG: hypothetical protein GXP62_19100 [Oligoflexia bacterium]|nr:hypothetical protein [Oligoflexia bacterium]
MTTQRKPGAPTARAVREHGDPVLAPILAQALSHTGSVQRASHGWHTYPASLHPDSAAELLDAFEGPVHDPFCGGGTVLVEARLAGRRCSGTDLSPIAWLVANARTASMAHVTPMRSAARKLAEKARLRIDVDVPETCLRWYEPHVAQEIGRLRDGILKIEDTDVRDLLWAVLSSVLIKASYRQSDTKNVRQPHHRPPGTTAILFHKKARELGRMLAELPEGPAPQLRVADAQVVGPPKGTRLILTSPPYPGVYDYLPMQQLRYAWLGIHAGNDMGAELGARRTFRSLGRAQALQQWRQNNARWIATQARGLEPGGWFGVVVGDGLVGDRLVDALQPTLAALQAAGLTVRARASADRPDHARDAVRIEHLVLAEKV